MHHEKPNFYKSMYKILGIMEKEPPLPQMWVETWWEYLHKSLQWFASYGDSCLALAKKMIAGLPDSDCHLAVWKDILKMASSPLIQVERAFMTEFLELFIIPALKYCQSADKETGFDPGYLARLWPITIREHILTLECYKEFPCDHMHFPKTENQLVDSLKDINHQDFFRNHIQTPFLKEAIQCITQHGSNWLEFSKVFAMGADQRCNNLMWRAIIRSFNK